MVFNSVSFVIFFVIFFFCYWFIFKNNLKLQNLLLLIASYIFYAKADWRLLPVLIGASIINFYLGIQLQKSDKHKKIILRLGIVASIGMLFYFKYFNFFIASICEFLQLFRFHPNIHLLNIIAPLGISFFTFRTISYLLDIYNGKIQPSKDWVVFFNYVAFFPTILSGPIDRAKPFIPQLEKKREFDYVRAVDGMKQILWGLFKKVIIADNCDLITSQIFGGSETMPASSILLGAILYTIQIYADFSGYSDMAIGISRLIGFNVTKNFNYPLFSQNIADFWRKWHISLTSWLTDYVFTPLCIRFRDFGKLGLIASIVINFTIIGIWHGPNWTYVLFGFLHGCYYIPLILRGTMNKKKKIAKDKFLPTFKEFANIISTFILVSLTFIIFRADNISDAFSLYTQLFSKSLFSVPLIPEGKTVFMTIIIFALLMVLVEWVQRDTEYGLQITDTTQPILRLSIYYVIIFSIIIFGVTASNQFIYFQF